MSKKLVKFYYLKAIRAAPAVIFICTTFAFRNFWTVFGITTLRAIRLGKCLNGHQPVKINRSTKIFFFLSQRKRNEKFFRTYLKKIEFLFTR